MTNKIYVGINRWIVEVTKRSVLQKNFMYVTLYLQVNLFWRAMQGDFFLKEKKKKMQTP